MPQTDYGLTEDGRRTNFDFMSSADIFKTKVPYYKLCWQSQAELKIVKFWKLKFWKNNKMVWKRSECTYDAVDEYWISYARLLDLVSRRTTLFWVPWSRGCSHRATQHESGEHYDNPSSYHRSINHPGTGFIVQMLPNLAASSDVKVHPLYY